eukprot:3287042-Pyramimonas_sp.AAC.1
MSVSCPNRRSRRRCDCTPQKGRAPLDLQKDPSAERARACRGVAPLTRNLVASIVSTVTGANHPGAARGPCRCRHRADPERNESEPKTLVPYILYCYILLIGLWGVCTLAVLLAQEDP